MSQQIRIENLRGKRIIVQPFPGWNRDEQEFKDAVNKGAQPEGEVIAIGDMVNLPLPGQAVGTTLPENRREIKVGDKIRWNRHAGDWFKFEGVHFFEIDENDVAGFLPDDYECNEEIISSRIIRP